jgi:predicted methyltransferase
MKKLSITCLFILSAGLSQVQAETKNVSSQHENQHSTSASLKESAIANHRSAKNIARNHYRHPVKTLEFFGLQPNMTVVEIWPGGGWYTEILAPHLKEEGQYYAAGFSLVAKRTPDWKKNYQRKFEANLKQHPELYSKTIITDLAIPERPDIAPGESADRVFTFRNVHNWMKGAYAQEVFNSMYKALKPGGILGVVEHRAKPGTSLEDMITSGYVTEAHVIKLAKKSGFKLAEKSEVNANAKDTKQHPKGVWTLPPSLRLGEENRAKYLAIGESDRMTLKFIKAK